MSDQGPRVVKLDGGGEAWAVGSNKPVPLGLAVTAGLKYSEINARSDLYAHTPPGAGDPAQRVSEQDRDGLDGELLFSSPLAMVLRQLESPEVQRACCTAYNDWLSEYCSEAPDRLFGVGLIPFTGLADAIAELERIAGLDGVVGAQLLKFPSGGEWLSDDDDAFWSVAQDLDVCVIAHHNFGGVMPGNAVLDPSARPASFSLRGNDDMEHLMMLMTCDMTVPAIPIITLLTLMLSGTLDRFPKLRFHFAETLIGWMPYWLEQMEDRYDRHRFWAHADLPRRPTQYIRDHFTFSFMEDHVGMAHRHDIGLGSLCWASDFPHSVSDWPWSLETVQRQMKDVPPNERLPIQALNVLRQVGVISASEEAELANQSLDERFTDADVPGRGERRL